MTRALIMLTLGLAAAMNSPARSETCADHALTARGEPARLEWLAKTKARANWRARVRATPGLGDAYSGWRQARDPQEQCQPSAAGVVCTFSGVPCAR